MQTKTTKIEAATALLNRAIATYLDHADYLSVVVLAGSAEDLLQGALTRLDRKADAARPQLLGAAQQIMQRIDPAGVLPSQSDALALLRAAFNWLRHNDRADPDPVEWDFEAEAETTLFRAIENWDTLNLPNPARAQEFVRFVMAKGPPSP